MPRKTPLREKIEALRRFYRQEGRLPGYAEMLKLFGYQNGAVERIKAGS